MGSHQKKCKFRFNVNITRAAKYSAKMVKTQNAFEILILCSTNNPSRSSVLLKRNMPSLSLMLMYMYTDCVLLLAKHVSTRSPRRLNFTMFRKIHFFGTDPKYALDFHVEIARFPECSSCIVMIAQKILIFHLVLWWIAHFQNFILHSDESLKNRFCSRKSFCELVLRKYKHLEPLVQNLRKIRKLLKCTAGIVFVTFFHIRSNAPSIFLMYWNPEIICLIW